MVNTNRRTFPFLASSREGLAADRVYRLPLSDYLSNHIIEGLLSFLAIQEQLFMLNI